MDKKNDTTINELMLTIHNLELPETLIMEKLTKIYKDSEFPVLTQGHLEQAILQKKTSNDILDDMLKDSFKHKDKESIGIINGIKSLMEELKSMTHPG